MSANVFDASVAPTYVATIAIPVATIDALVCRGAGHLLRNWHQPYDLFVPRGSSGIDEDVPLDSPRPRRGAISGQQTRGIASGRLIAVAYGSPVPESTADPTYLVEEYFAAYVRIDRAHPSSVTLVGHDEDAVRHLARRVLHAVRALDNGQRRRRKAPSQDIKDVRSTAGASEYAAQVAHIRERILAGDLFQANLSRELTVEWPGATRADVAGFAERLLTQTNAPFGAILHDGPNRTIVSASPERFFRVERLGDGRLKVIAEPIKGTRPRHADPVVDRAAAEELLGSEKDRAENVMIADLVRNDLSLVCEDESITVERLCELRSFATVHHLVTTVTGILRPGRTALDALRAQFPCGSITGAPKLAAMDLISELEQRERGIYCGAIGYVAADGSADFSVAIRTATVDYHAGGATIRYGVGGGVTALSDPGEEYRETEDKAADFLRALRP